MAQWLKELALSLLWLGGAGSILGLGIFACHVNHKEVRSLDTVVSGERVSQREAGQQP